MHSIRLIAAAGVLLFAGCASAPSASAPPVPSTRETVTTSLGQTLRVSGPEYAPKVLRRVPPHYPETARANGTRGPVTLEALIDPTGNVVDVNVLDGRGDGLDEAAAAAARQWKFEPTLENGQPIPVLFELIINFKL